MSNLNSPLQAVIDSPLQSVLDAFVAFYQAQDPEILNMAKADKGEDFWSDCWFDFKKSESAETFLEYLFWTGLLTEEFWTAFWKSYKEKGFMLPFSAIDKLAGEPMDWLDTGMNQPHWGTKWQGLRKGAELDEFLASVKDQFEGQYITEANTKEYWEEYACMTSQQAADVVFYFRDSVPPSIKPTPVKPVKEEKAMPSPAKVKTAVNPTLISLQSDSHVRSQAILSTLLDMTWLDLWFVGLMPEVVRIDEWQWDAPVLSPNSDASSEVKWDEDEAEDWIENADLYELNPKQKLILGMNLKGWKGAQVIAKLNFLLLLKAEKGAVLPQEWLDALTGELPIYWSKNQSITPSWLLRIVKAFGHDVSAPPDGKPDPTGVWVGDKTPFVGKGVKWSGPILTTSEGMEHSYLQQADFGGFLLSIATEIKEENTLLLYDTLWVQWKHEGIFLPGIRRENRNYYTIRFGAVHRWIAVEDTVDCPHSLWGNQLIRWAVNGASSGAISKAVNRDATQLVAPSRLYGDPSTLNRSQDHNTVGHLEMGVPSWGVHYTGPGSMLPDMLSDCDSFAPIRAAEFAYQDGLPVLYQHQLENVRVGEIAAACGKSTVNVTVKCKDGMLKTIQVAIGQFLVDKATKLFNRDSLLGRCPAIVHIFRKGVGNPEAKKALSSLKAKAKGLLNKG